MGVEISENIRYLMFTCADSYIIEINLILTVNIISVRVKDVDGYCIRPIKRMVPNKRIPTSFRGNWGISKRQRSSPYVISPADKPKNRSLCDRIVKIGIYVLLHVEIHIRS